MFEKLKLKAKSEENIFKVPRTMQEIIPVKEIYEDGIFLLDDNYYSKTWKFDDINYQVFSDDEKMRTIAQYIELINSLDAGSESKITINNRKIDKVKFYDEVLLKPKNDSLDSYRAEYNEMLKSKVEESNSVIQEKYITTKIKRQNIDDARSYFNRLNATFESLFTNLNSGIHELRANERVKIFHDFFRVGEESEFFYDFNDSKVKGHSFKDYILPDGIEIKNDYLKLGDTYTRILFIREYANYLTDDMIAELTEFNKNMVLNIDIKQLPLNESIKLVQDKLLGVESNISDWQEKSNSRGNFVLDVPYHLRQQRDSVEEILKDLTKRDQRMIMTCVTIALTANSLEELDSDTDVIKITASKNSCQMGVLKFQQLDGLLTTLPFGITKIKAIRTLNSESVATLMPFRVQEVYQPTGVYYGQNAISKNIILADRYLQQNPNSFILGTSGSGKSFTAKQELIHTMLASESDVIIIDPDSEYSPLVRALGGEVINLSTNSQNHINAMETVELTNDDENFINVKSEFMLTLMEMALDKERYGLSPLGKSIIDRCVHYVYEKFQPDNLTLLDFYEVLKKQPEDEADELAGALEIFVKGSLNSFAYPTNVDVKNRLVCFDIRDLGDQLKPIGMLIMLDNIFNRVKENRVIGKRTYLFIDEIHILFNYEYATDFLQGLWKRIRKYSGCITGITQNIDDLLSQETARTMLNNSEFLILLNQTHLDAMKLQEVLDLSDEQLKYINGVGKGQGLIKVGSQLIPFKNSYPNNSLYKLMDTSSKNNY